jgi:UDP-N-acetylmuramate dehydrogenase
MELLEHVPLSAHTTFRVGGEARFFVHAATVEELREALAYAREHKLPVCIIGGGSNTLFSDRGWSGLVIRIALMGSEYQEDSMGDARVTVAAGTVWDTLVEDTVSQGLWGMENLSGIPGTVGATPVQNVGAYGVEVADIIDWVEVLDSQTGDMHVLSSNECAFEYRDSIFKHTEGKHYIVTRVAFRLSTHPTPKLEYRDLKERFGERTDVTVQEVRDAIMEIRNAKFPDLTTVGTAGSFFKNPIITKHHYEELKRTFNELPCYSCDEGYVKVPLGWILERLGWKGKRVGNVGCWEAQSLVLVQYGNATASELLLFAHAIMQDVQKHTTIKIEPEVRVLGEK